jgi:PilZ domain
MNYIRANYFNKEEFLKAWNHSDGVIFCPTVTSVKNDQDVVVELHIPGVHDKTLVRGTVISSRKPVPRRGIRGGALLQIHESEIDKITYLVDIFNVEGLKPTKRRKHPRLSVTLSIRFRIMETVQYYDAKLLDIAEGGARMSIDESIDLVGKKIFLELQAPGGVRPISFLADVKNKISDNLYGIAFITREKGNFSLLKEFLRRLKSGEYHIPLIFFSLFLWPLYQFLGQPPM